MPQIDFSQPYFGKAPGQSTGYNLLCPLPDRSFIPVYLNLCLDSSSRRLTELDMSRNCTACMPAAVIVEVNLWL
ncbi:hypothetical protein D3C76_1540740 [compost metagenome]